MRRPIFAAIPQGGAGAALDRSAAFVYNPPPARCGTPR